LLSNPALALVTVKAGAQQVIDLIHITACGAASREYVFDDPEL
jgi:hypothetical protein